MGTLLRAFLLRALPLLSMLLLVHVGHGQGWTGLAHSNYGGTNNVYINPATLADSRHKFYLNVVGGNMNFYNTYLELNLPGQPGNSLMVPGSFAPITCRSSFRAVPSLPASRAKCGCLRS